MRRDASEPELAANPSDSPEHLLLGVPFFRTLDRVDVAHLVGVLEQVELPAGTLIVAEGAAADGMYLLERGRVAVSVTTAAGASVRWPICRRRGTLGSWACCSDGAPQT